MYCIILIRINNKINKYLVLLEEPYIYWSHVCSSLRYTVIQQVTCVNYCFKESYGFSLEMTTDIITHI